MAPQKRKLAIKKGVVRSAKSKEPEDSGKKPRLIPLVAPQDKDFGVRTKDISGDWSAVDARARAEAARRRPSAELQLRANRIADLLDHEYPGATCALTHKTPLQLLVATILSAQCTDARVNQVTPALFSRYRCAADFAMSPPGELEEAIRSTGFFNNKARAIRACCGELLEHHGGDVPREMELLAALPGVGRKTASVLRATAYGLPGITVDTHVHRLSRRLGLTDDEDAERIEFDLASLLPPERWSQFSHAVILHGRRICSARRPDCAGCCLQKECPSAGIFDD